MGSIITKLDSNNKVLEVRHESQNKNEQLPQDILDKYKTNLNTNGALIVNLRAKAVIDLLKKYYERAKGVYSAEELKNIPNPDGLAFALIFISMFSQFGFYTMVDQSTQGPQSKEMPEFIKIIVPMSIIKNDTTFINFIFSDMISKLQKDTKDVDSLKSVFITLVQSLNKNTTTPEIRLVNILNLSIHFGIVIAIVSNAKSKNSQENLAVVSELLGPFISSFPDNVCYFDKDNILSTSPNVCQGKSTAQNCPACPLCPPCNKSDSDNTFKYISIGLGILAFLFFIMYLTKKTKSQPILDSDSDSE